MAVRKTERNLPFNFSASDLGESISSPNEKIILISFLSSPLIINRLQRYVIFVLDENFFTQIDNYEWLILGETIQKSFNTSFGYLEYTPEELDILKITVELRDNLNQVLATIEIEQNVGELNYELEELYNQEETYAPVIGNIDTARELVNDIKFYIDELVSYQENELLNRLITSITYHEILRLPIEKRAKKIELIANSLNEEDNTEFLDQGEDGIGLCQLRPIILGMYFLKEDNKPIIVKRTIPPESIKRREVFISLLNDLKNLDNSIIIDLFNTLRFPKLNLKMCKILLEESKKQLYGIETFEDISIDSGKIIQIIEHFKEGQVSKIKV